MWMRLVYNCLLPVFFLLAAPAWILRMARRGGLDRRLFQRITIYQRPPASEKKGVIYVHAVSVGEVRMALRLVGRWNERSSSRSFVIAATTTTGFQIAEREAPQGVRVIYSPLDLPVVTGRVFSRFEPVLVVLIDSEIWPNLLHICGKRDIPVALANARLSERSARRYERLKPLALPMLRQIGKVFAQAEEHTKHWNRIGVPADRIVVTGSLKFDLDGAEGPRERAEFGEMLESFGAGRSVVLAASTHHGEEALLAKAIRKIPEALPVLLPRHAERRRVVQSDLERAGFEVVLRSSFAPPEQSNSAAFLIDSTGELAEWTAHADIVIIGKSFLGRGGQNPVEAILAGVPVICGPHMNNFEPLFTELRNASAVECVSETEVADSVQAILRSKQHRRRLTENARVVIEQHRGATDRTIMELEELL